MPLVSHARFPFILCLLAGGLTCLACEEEKKPELLKENSALKVEEVAETKPVKAKRAPIFEIDESSVKVSYERFLIDRPNALAKMEAELDAQKDYIDGKELALNIHRKAKLNWVTTYLASLETRGAIGFVITTKTRGDYPKTVTFSALHTLADAPKCSVVSVIAKDRTTATWKLSGGTARQRNRGLGGPDLSMTGLTIESVAKSCKKSDVIFVSGDESVEWGMIYDLAASTTQLEKKTFSRRGLLSKSPTIGKKVSL